MQVTLCAGALQNLSTFVGPWPYSVKSLQNLAYATQRNGEEEHRRDTRGVQAGRQDNNSKDDPKCQARNNTNKHYCHRRPDHETRPGTPWHQGQPNEPKLHAWKAEYAFNHKPKHDSLGRFEDQQLHGVLRPETFSKTKCSNHSSGCVFEDQCLILPNKLTRTPDMRQLQGESSSKPQVFIQRREVPKGVPTRLCQTIWPAALRAAIKRDKLQATKTSKCKRQPARNHWFDIFTRWWPFLTAVQSSLQQVWWVNEKSNHKRPRSYQTNGHRRKSFQNQAAGDQELEFSHGPN